MDHHLIANFLGVLAVILVVARLFGMGARAIGQPAVLGELLAGVVLGASVVGLIRPDKADLPGTLVLGFLAEMGVVILLFEIGLETDLTQLRFGGKCAASTGGGHCRRCAGSSPADTWCATGFGQSRRGMHLGRCKVALTATIVGITKVAC